MTRAYRLFLRLYPRDYQELFATEMLGVFEEAAGLHRWPLWFLVTELGSLANGAAMQWFGRAQANLPAKEPLLAGMLAAALIHLAIYRLLIPIVAFAGENTVSQTIKDTHPARKCGDLFCVELRIEERQDKSNSSIRWQWQSHGAVPAGE